MTDDKKTLSKSMQAVDTALLRMFVIGIYIPILKPTLKAITRWMK